MDDPELFSLRNTIANECGVCLRMIDHDATKDESLEIAMWGAAQFAWCIGCGRTVPPAIRTPEYERRWTEFARVLSNRVRGARRLIDKHGDAASVMVGLRGGIPEVRISIGDEITVQTCDTLGDAEDFAIHVRGVLIAMGFAPEATDSNS
jgi:hypothetical protein